MNSEQHKYLAFLLSQKSFPADAFYLNKEFAGKKIIVYGAGESFHYFKEIVMRRYGYTPALVLDRRFQPGDIFEGVPAYPLDAYTPTEDDCCNALVVICLGNQTYYDDVVHSLRDMGFCNIISLNDIYEIHNPFCLPSELDRLGFQYYLDKREQIESCMELFADELSRDIYVKCLQTHLMRKPVPLPMSSRHEQYTPDDVPLVRGYARFIYCGVSVGELASVFRRVGVVEELVCFEPDPNQYQLTAAYLSENYDDIASRVTVIPCAVYGRDSQEAFTYSDTSFGSRILPSGEFRIQTVTIDHALPGFRPTIITMDVEGAELEALRGAETTLRENSPDLAVCVYHSPSHLWEIPRYINSLGLGYRFYLRNYTSFIGETVLYAVSDISMTR